MSAQIHADPFLISAVPIPTRGISTLSSTRVGIAISCRVDQVGQNAWCIDCRDSFITKQDKYRWAEPFVLYRDDSRPTHNTSTTYKLHETVPDYFSGAVLQRHHLNDRDPGVVTLKFQVAFNLAVVWMIVFVSLSKGKCLSANRPRKDFPSLTPTAVDDMLICSDTRCF